MRKIYTAIVLLFAAASLFAQTKLTYKNNGLNIGDVRNMKQIEYLPQGDGGANQVWDFSKAKVLKDMAIAQNANVATQVGNLDLTSRNTLLACDEGGEKTTYFEITNTEKKYWGLTSGNVKIEFNAPVVDLKFPFAYQDMIAGSMDGAYVDNGVSYPITGNYSTTADAWGSLTLPDGNTYNGVLRIKVDKNYQQLSGGTTYTIHTIRYQYYAEGVRYPVLIVLENEIKSDCNCACGSSKSEYAYYLPVSKAENGAKAIVSTKDAIVNNDVKINVYPNPFHESLSANVVLSADAEANIDIVDAAGRKIKDFGEYNLVSGTNDVNLETGDLVQGHYFLRVSVNGVNYAKSVFKK